MTDNGKLGVGVVGIGWVSHQHIDTLVKNPHTEVVGLCSASRENAENAKEEHGLANAHIYTDYEQMLKQDNLDMVYICSTNEKHVSQVLAAADAGKHMLIEKPAALNWEDMKAIVAAVEKAGVVACEGFELHWSPYFLIVHKLIKANAFGNIFYGECDYFSANWPQWYVGYPWVKTREQGGSALAAAGCHAVDALLQFMPGEVDHVVGHWGNFTKTFDWEGTVLSVISYKDGRIGKVGCILEGNNPYSFNVRLHGDRGTLVGNKFHSETLIGERMTEQTDWATFETIMPDTPEVAHHPFQPQTDHIIDCILNNKKPEVDIHDALKIDEVIFAAERSASLGGERVKLPLE